MKHGNSRISQEQEIEFEPLRGENQSFAQISFFGKTHVFAIDQAATMNNQMSPLIQEQQVTIIEHRANSLVLRTREQRPENNLHRRNGVNRMILKQNSPHVIRGIESILSKRLHGEMLETKQLPCSFVLHNPANKNRLPINYRLQQIASKNLKSPPRKHHSLSEYFLTSICQISIP